MEKTNELLRELGKVDKEWDKLYHDVAVKIGISDSAFSIFYILYNLGDGCLQKDICQEAFVNKQTINSSIRRLEQEGYLYLEQGRGQDKHIYLTDAGKRFVEKNIVPIIKKENEAFAQFSLDEQKELLRLSKIHIEYLKSKLAEL